MKTILLALVLVLTGLDLWAQLPPNSPGGVPRRLSRFGGTNNPAQRFQSGQAGQGFPGNPGFPGARPPGGIPAGAPGGALGAPGNPGAPGGAPLTSVDNSSAAFAAQPEEMIAPGTINFQGVDLSEVLDIYAKLVNRTLLRAALPQAQIVLKTQTPLTKTETIQALQAVLALNGVSLVNIGDKFVKVVPSDQASGMGAEIDEGSSTNLPNLGSYVTHVVQLKYIKPSLMQPIIAPFSRLANAILPIDDNGILVLRDYAENVKRMLEMIEKVDVSVPAEYISEVIPIRYAKVDDIASALNALGGAGSGAMVSIGGSSSSGQISGFSQGRSGGLGGSGGMSSMGGVGGSSYGGGYGGGNGMGGTSGGLGGSSFGGARTQTSPNGTSSGANSFQQRLNNIINATSSGGGAGGKQQDIQLFGETKIIPNESSSSLLIYATREDMKVIEGIIAKLDVPLAQVLVEAAIIDYSLGPNTFNFGLSASQNPVQNGAFIGGGGVNNSSGGSPFIHFIQSISNITNGLQTNGLFSSLTQISSIASSASGSNSVFGNNLPGGASYFASIGPNWDVALNAAQSDSHATVIQRPRIQTSQAKPAQFFVGDTVPYVTGNSYGTAYGSGVSYSQLSVGVELDVTPFINPDGLVVMDIEQEIDDLNGYTTIDNVGQVPNTIKRTLNAEIAVRDRDTVMLGGFIKANKSTSRSGVPFLMDIPIIGNLFLQRNDSKQREELIVLMRPTVLPTPELAAKHTFEEEQTLPGVARAETEDAQENRTLVDAERKRELREYKANAKNIGFFTPQPLDTNNPSLNLVVPSANSRLQTEPGTEIEEVRPAVPPPVAPGSGMQQTAPSVPSSTPPPPAPVPVPVPSPTSGTAPGANNNTAPMDEATMQQKAAAALAQKMMELNSTNSAH